MCFFLPMSCKGEGERLEKDTEAGTEQVLAMPGEEALGLSPRPMACKLKRLRKQRFLFLPPTPALIPAAGRSWLTRRALPALALCNAMSTF